jgi:hypothetical protein
MTAARACITSANFTSPRFALPQMGPEEEPYVTIPFVQRYKLCTRKGRRYCNVPIVVLAQWFTVCLIPVAGTTNL